MSLTCATSDSALAPGPIVPRELGWLDFVPVDGILVVHPRVALLEQQLEPENGACEPRDPSPSAQHLRLRSSPATSVNSAVLETYSRDGKTEAEVQRP